MVQSPVIITDGRFSIVSHKEPIPANRSRTLGIVATAPALKHWQRWMLAATRIATTTIAFVCWQLVMGDGYSIWYSLFAHLALIYHWTAYWFALDKIKPRQEFLLDVFVDNDMVGDDDFIKWYLKGAREDTATPLLTCYAVWVALIMVRYIPHGIALPQPLATAYLVAIAGSLSVACFGQGWAIKKFQKLY